jgi:hypothetical protein
MKRKMRTATLPILARLMIFWYAGGIGAQPILATGSDADVTKEGLHRVHPSIMAAAWVRPDLDLSRYSRILLMPSAVQFREVREQLYDARSSIGITEFPVDQEKKEWLREVWAQAVDESFEKAQSYDLYYGVDSDVLVVQAFLVDVVSRIPPKAAGSYFTWVRNPWGVHVVLELRDAVTAELVARTIDRRYAEGLVDVDTVWMRTSNLVGRWANVLPDRLDELADLGERGRRTPTWAR